MDMQIGRYQVIRKIGTGSMASVYLAQAGAETVALKVLHKYLALDPIILERFRREVVIARELKHENIIQIYDVLTWEEQPTIVLEYCAGGNLAGFVASNSDEVIDIACSLTKALAFAHSKGIIHRDLKPENILRTQETVKVCDFGSAHVQNLMGITTSTMFAGTPQYIAPELLAGEHADPRSDLYSLGAILFQVLTGKQHRDPSLTSLFHNPLPLPTDFPATAPAWLVSIIINLLGDIEKRITDADTLLYLLERQEAPGVRKVKSCLFCHSLMAEELPCCLQCGRPELELIPDYSATARFVVLKKITEDVEPMYHFLSMLKAISGIQELEFKFITGDARYYSKEEKKEGIVFPVRAIDHIPAAVCEELIALLTGSYYKQIKLESRPMKEVRKIKRGPLILLKSGVIRVPAAEKFVTQALSRRMESDVSENRKLFTRIVEAGCRVLQKAEGVDEKMGQVLEQLLDHSLAACNQLNRLEEYLVSVSLADLYNEQLRCAHLLEKSENPAEIQTLIERKQEQQRLYIKYQQQEAKYAMLKSRVLELYGKLTVLANTGLITDQAMDTIQIAAQNLDNPGEN